METKLSDVFVSYSRADSVQVGTWLKRLRKGGVTIWYDGRRDNGAARWKMSPTAAAERCEVLIWFVSKFGGVSQDAGSIVTAACNNGKAVLIVSMDTTPVPGVFDLSHPKISVVNMLVLGRLGTWEAILKGIRSQGVAWIGPGTKRRLSNRPNERRSSLVTRAWLRASILSLVIAVVGGWLWSRHKRAVPGEQVAQKAVPVAVPPPTQPPAPAPQPAIPVEVSPVVTDPRSNRAIEYVTQCIGATAREHGLTPAQIDAAAEYFADPVRMEGLGLQPASAIKATLQARQQELPKYKETIHFANAQETPDPACREVTVLLSYSGETAGKEPRNGIVKAHYIVDFTDEQKPKIIQLWVDEQKAQ